MTYLTEKLKQDKPEIYNRIHDGIFASIDETADSIDIPKILVSDKFDRFLVSVILASKAMAKSEFDKWMQALESKSFKQTIEILYNDEDETYCCLGVLCHINGINNNDMSECADLLKLSQYFAMPFNLYECPIVTFQTPFIEMNDEYHLSFKEIASLAKWARSRRLPV